MAEKTENNKNQNSKKSSIRLIKPRRKLTEDERGYAKTAFALAIFCLFLVLGHYFYFTIRYTYSDWLCILMYAMIFIAPGYLANGGMLVWGGKGPQMDFGYVCKDGKRLFGEGKTWRGFILGPIAFGIPIALVIHVILYLNWPAILDLTNYYYNDLHIVYKLYPTEEGLLSDMRLYFLGATDGNPDLHTFLILLPRVILTAFGAGVGDLIGSWAKRRTGIARGAPFWIVDQIDFIFGCFLLPLPIIVGHIHIHTIIFLLIFTPSLTVFANTVSYLTGHKKVPW